jgi:hypothetical protein
VRVGKDPGTQAAYFVRKSWGQKLRKEAGEHRCGTHGIAPFRVPIVAKHQDRSRINVMRHAHKNEPDSRGLDPAIHYLAMPCFLALMAASSAAMRAIDVST